MITNSWCPLIITFRGKISTKQSQKTFVVNKIICDECNSEYDERIDHTERKKKSYAKDLCAKCSRKKQNEIYGQIGAKSLKSISKEDRKKNAAAAGRVSAKSPNAGRFTSGRWKAMSKKEQRHQVTTANKALYDKLNNDENLKIAHYKKVFQNSRIGFISKGHNELHDFLKEYGFSQHVQISDMETDECNESKKYVVEFNGDMYHCNPNKWQADQYNEVIKMTAKQKWEADKRRMYKLRRMGYKVFVVWESDWNKNRGAVKESLLKHFLLDIL